MTSIERSDIQNIGGKLRSRNVAALVSFAAELPAIGPVVVFTQCALVGALSETTGAEIYWWHNIVPRLSWCKATVLWLWRVPAATRLCVLLPHTTRNVLVPTGGSDYHTRLCKAKICG